MKCALSIFDDGDGETILAFHFKDLKDLKWVTGKRYC